MYRNNNFDLTYIEREFDRLSSVMEHRISLFVAGGGAMAYYRLKEATKDIDVIVETKSKSDMLKHSLLASGYSEIPIRRMENPYRRMNAQNVVQNLDGFRWDIFVRRVAGRLELSGGMKERANRIYDSGNLRASVLSKEDIFVLKAITERESDLEDMSKIAKSGLSYSTVLEECSLQSEAGGRVWTGYLYGRCLELKEKFGIVVPILRELKRTATKENIAWAREREKKMQKNKREG